MTEDEIYEQLITSAEAGIKAVLEGLSKSFKTRFLCHKDIDGILTSLGAVVGELESNGWQWDTWQDWAVSGKKLLVTGGGYYGGITISLVEDYDQ